MNKQAELKKAYVKLTALKNNLPASKNTEEKYANIYNSEVDRLIDSGFDLEEFKISREAIKIVSTGGNYVKGKTYYSKKKFVDREIFLMKLESVLAYFSISNPETKIGFDLD